MGWSIGYDDRWKRDIGYGVPALCDHPECGAEIDRGLGYVCGSEPYGGEHGCGLYFCSKHRQFAEVNDDCVELCERCSDENSERWFDAKPDIPRWIQWKLTDESCQIWRNENPEEIKRLQDQLTEHRL